MNWETAHPGADIDIVIPHGFHDTSWHNDACPSFEWQHGPVVLRLWVDYRDPDEREGACERFGLVMYESDESPSDSTTIADTDDWSEMLDHIRRAQENILSNAC